MNPDNVGYFNAEDSNVEEALYDLLRQTHPQYVINCAGVLKAEMDSSTSTVVLRGIRVNAVLPHVLHGASRPGNPRFTYVN